MNRYIKMFFLCMSLYATEVINAAAAGFTREEAFAVLGLESGATEGETRKAYLRLALKWHPDKNINNKEEAEEKFKEINGAYALLTGKSESRAAGMPSRTAETPSYEDLRKSYEAYGEFADLYLDPEFMSYRAPKILSQTNLDDPYFNWEEEWAEAGFINYDLLNEINFSCTESKSYKNPVYRELAQKALKDPRIQIKLKDGTFNVRDFFIGFTYADDLPSGINARRLVAAHEAIFPEKSATIVRLP